MLTGQMTNVMSVSKIDAALPNFTYMQTERVRVVGPTGLSKLTRCVLDSEVRPASKARSL
jgi:hypothetical protein